MHTSFESLNLYPALLTALAELGYTEPTPVQAEAIPVALDGGDWMVASQTGSGKTAAFLLPTISRIATGDVPIAIKAPEAMGRRGRGQTRHVAAPQILVLCPTRELAAQVAQEAIKLVRHMRGMRVATILGGMPFAKQIAELANARVVVATPGRLLDLHNQGKISLASVAALIVDEADRMLDLGFSEDLEAIQSLAGGRDQTLMFSATFAPRIMALAERMMKSPGRIELASATERHENISQALFYADNYAHKNKLLDHWLGMPDMDQAIVFARTQTETEEIADRLVGEGHAATALHGAMPQAVRNRRLQGLRRGQVKVLVATDVAARGIDVPTISHVINFGLPMKPEDYVHRIGRTGRAGRNGMAVTFAEASERGKVRAIERFIDNSIPEEVVAGLEPTRRSVPARGTRGNGQGAGRKDFGTRARAPRQNRDAAGTFGYTKRGEGQGTTHASAPQAQDFSSAPRQDSARAFAAPRDFAPRNDGGRQRNSAVAGDAAREHKSFTRAERAPRNGGDRGQSGFGQSRSEKSAAAKRTFAKAARQGESGTTTRTFASDSQRGEQGARTDRGFVKGGAKTFTATKTASTDRVARRGDGRSRGAQTGRSDARRGW